MTYTDIKEEVNFQFDSLFYNDQKNKIIEHVLPQFDRILRRYLFFHLTFLFLMATEILLLTFFSKVLINRSIFSYSLCLLFLTAATYFILRLYFKSKKTEDFILLKDNFLKAIQNIQQEMPEKHVAIAHFCTRFAELLQSREYDYFRFPKWFYNFSQSLENLSCWCYWEDVHHMREILLKQAVDEYILLVKCEPTNLEVHVALANAYVMLSSLYMNSRKSDDGEDDRWIPEEKYHEEMEKKYRIIAKKAIEEFKILNDYAPDDPWVHAQLAYSYHDLKMPEEEIREYEIILSLRPDDKETLFKLGILYFQQGKNAKGLQIYEELKRSNFKKAENLVQFYH